MECCNPEFYIEHLPTVDSTNNYVRAEAKRLWGVAGKAEVVAVYADEQTAGRGQRGNVWLSRAGENLLVSLLVRPSSLPVVRQFALSQAVALAVKGAMGYYGIDAVLKWPNDIYVGGRKLAGILVELDYSSSLVESAVVGVGLNVNEEVFSPMDKVPVSMKMLLGTSHEVEDVLSALLDGFSYYYAMLQRGEYDTLATDYKRSLMGYGKTMRFRVGEHSFEAVIKGVESDGRLCLLHADGSERLYAFKEVEMVI